MRKEKNELESFPFKNMLAMKEVILQASNGASIEEVANGGNSCYPDTVEIMSMMIYLLNFGKIKRTKSGWHLISSSKNASVTRGFRARFLENVVKIMMALDGKPQKREMISIKTGINPKLVRKYLLFLELLSVDGRVSRKNGNYFVQQW
ncbi:MAG: hypothetical protein ACTSVI_08300 [Promethearchaeota archaeon]